MNIEQTLVEECKSRLLEAKEDIINRVRESKDSLVKEDTTGDEGDQTMRVLQESEFVANQERLRTQLLEIESALSRIDSGTYGVCEETEELIEPERLRAIPWTRLSIEGAEMRESQQKKYAR
jgi:DnaK suppressor protein